MCPGYDTKKSDDEVPVMLELWGMQITPSLLSLPGLYWAAVVTHDRVLFMAKLELKIMIMIKWISWNRTVLIFKLRTYPKLIFFKNWTFFCILNWIVSNRTVLAFNCVSAKTILTLT